jgi:hypothetical protein
MLLGKHKISTDGGDLTLADLSMDNATIESPVRMSPSGLSRSLQNTPHVADLVQKFSSPGPAGTPLRRIASESLATPTAAYTPPAASASPTPVANTVRRISPLPKRSPLGDVAETDTPVRPLKRKGSHTDLVLESALQAAQVAIETPIAQQAALPAFEEPLIAFGDSPLRLAADRAPFVFKGSRLLSRMSTVHDLMSLDLGGLDTPAKPRVEDKMIAEEDEDEDEDEADVTVIAAKCDDAGHCAACGHPGAPATRGARTTPGRH